MSITLKTTALVAPVLLLIGVYFKTMHWPGANVLLVTGAAAAILLVVLLLTSIPSKLTRSLEKFTFIIAMVTLLVGFLAFVFKLQHLAGAAWLIGTADIGILLSCVLLVADGLLEKDPIKGSLKFIAAFFAVLLLLVIFLTR